MPLTTHDSREETVAAAVVKSPRSESVPSVELAKSGENGKEFADVLHRLDSSGNGNFLSPVPPHLPAFRVRSFVFHKTFSCLGLISCPKI